MPRVLILLLALGSSVLAAPEQVTVSEISPHLAVFGTSSGNVAVSFGDDGALLIGTPSAASTPEINRLIEERTKSAKRYAVIFPEPIAQSQGDAGWRKLGAFVAMQEKGLERLGGHAMGPPKPLPEHLIQLGVDRPRVAFSEVLTFDVNDDAIHVVHQPSGFSDADCIVHFHRAGLVYVGEVFPGDGYPLLDPDLGANLKGLLKTLHSWTNPHMKVVPVFGKTVTGAEVGDYYNMITAVRDAVQKLVDAKQTEDQIVAQHPSASFDARWGKGRVSPDAFVRELYTALTAQN